MAGNRLPPQVGGWGVQQGRRLTPKQGRAAHVGGGHTAMGTAASSKLKPGPEWEGGRPQAPQADTQPRGLETVEQLEASFELFGNPRPWKP